MSEGRSAPAANQIGVGAARVARAWRSLPPERRLAAIAAILLFLSLFLPWYQRQFFVVVGGTPHPASDSQTGWAAFSFVEAAVLLAAGGVLVLLFQRAEGRAFHVPGGDGGVIMAAGLWACVLIVWRMFDKQGASSHGADITSYGIEWGIFAALAVAGLLAYAGSRIRAAHVPEPPLPGESPTVAPPAQGESPTRTMPPPRESPTATMPPADTAP